MKTFLQSVSYAIKGLRAALAGQRHIRFHVGAAMLVVAAGIALEVTAGDWVLLIFAIGLVLTTELVNSAIEAVVDLVEPRLHPLAGKAKDIAAGAVLVASVTALLIGLLVFYKYLPL
ncbi:MAG: diacylglycerol kinase family protein [Cyclobacteriaceae bacterium]|nr:diacylglycerol kinase family protein [Cyclobacteriaceae bacterium]